MTAAQNQTAAIERGQTYLVVPTRNSRFKAVHPFVGPGTYQNTGNQILGQGLKIPTGEETAFLIDEVYNSENDEFRKSSEAESIRKIMKDNWLWLFNREIWMPRKGKNPGLYVIQDSKVEGISAPFSLEELQDKLSGGETERGVQFSKDRTTAFAPYSTFSLGVQPSKDLSNSGFAISNYSGVDGAEKISKVAENFTLNPSIYGVSENKEPVQRVAGLSRGWYIVGGLDLDGCSRGSGTGSFAFGVSENVAEGDTPKNR